MYIILKRHVDDVLVDEDVSCTKQEILNVFYCDDVSLVRNWIRDYINEDIQSRQMCPLPKDTRSIVYEINDGDSEFELIRRTKMISKGYIYNGSERKTDVLYAICALEYKTERVLPGLTSDQMWGNINDAINNRVLKQLDRDSLYQVVVKLQQAVNSRPRWNRLEFTSLLSDITRNFRKDLYSTIAKRMRRFGKRKDLVPSNFNTTGNNACKIEAIRLSKDSRDSDDHNSC